MTTQQWRLKKIPEPRTLADVPSSREKPVLCWNRAGDRILRAFVQGCMIRVLHSCGLVEDYENSENASKFPLYTQPSRPTKLEDVPDRRVMLGEDGASMWFVECGSWHRKTLGQGNSSFVPMNCRPVRWQLTDCIVELETVAVGVLT